MNYNIDNAKMKNKTLYMREYRKKRKCNDETKDVENAKMENKPLYMRKYRKKRKCNDEKKDVDNAKREKKNSYMKKYRNKMKHKVKITIKLKQTRTRRAFGRARTSALPQIQLRSNIVVFHTYRFFAFDNLESDEWHQVSQLFFYHGNQES